MNKKGQTLVTFIIFIPILLTLAAFVVDTGVIMRERAKLRSTSNIILTNVAKEIDASEIEIKIIDLYKKNNINTDNIKINIYDNQITIDISYKIESIFGQIIGIKEYEIKEKFIDYLIEKDPEEQEELELENEETTLEKEIEE